MNYTRYKTGGQILHWSLTGATRRGRYRLEVMQRNARAGVVGSGWNMEREKDG